MIEKAERRLRIGVLGCGPIAQAAHLDACRKARNADLEAICDLSDELRERMSAIHRPRSAYRDYAAMLADDRVEAIVVAIADEFHVAAALQALEAKKPVLVEKPMGTTVESCRELHDRAARLGLVLQVGNNRRFDPGVASAVKFIKEQMGERIALKAWYHDSLYRYTMTDNLQPIPIKSAASLRPEGSPKADRPRYLLLTHGSHLVDTARHLGGEIVSVRARRAERFEAYCWFIDVDFADGSLGHLELQVPVRGDFQEGFTVYGEHGSVEGRIPLPWYHKSSEVSCFSARDRAYHRVLGEDAHTYRRQLEGFAAAVLGDAEQVGANAMDGLEAVKTLVAISRSAESGRTVRVEDAAGGV